MISGEKYRVLAGQTGSIAKKHRRRVNIDLGKFIPEPADDQQPTDKLAEKPVKSQNQKA